MLPPYVKTRIEKKYGQAIRYPKDCEGLSADISSKIKEQISASTLKRLFGFVKGPEKAQRYTLDVLARYLGHNTWEDVIRQEGPGAETVSIEPGNTHQPTTQSLKKIYALVVLGILAVTATLILLNRNSSAGVQKTNAEVVQLAPLPEVRSGGALLNVGSAFYYIGGADAEFVRDNNWCYDTITKEWKTLTPLSVARAECGCTELNGLIYCFGGWLGNDSGCTAHAEVYSIKDNTWSRIPDLPMPLTSLSAVNLNGRIYIMGGTVGETQNAFYCYDPQTQNYELLPNFSVNRLFADLVVCRNRIYAIGGQSFTKGSYNFHNNVDEYVPSEHKWVQHQPLPAAISRSAIVSTNNKITLVSGTNKIGYDSTGFSDWSFTYDPLTDSWTKEKCFWKGIAASAVNAGSFNYFAGGNQQFPNPSRSFFRVRAAK